jgi:hypothetical protein
MLELTIGNHSHIENIMPITNTPPKLTTFDIVYRCHKRKALFKRKVVIDDDLEIKRALSVAVFETREKAGIIQLVVKSIKGFTTKSAGICQSVPVYLFGESFNHVNRRDTSLLWNLSRSAYLLPIKEIA